MIDEDNATALVRVRLFGPFEVERRNEAGIWEMVDKAHWDRGYARSLFKRLLSSGGRPVDRLTLIDDLWPHLDTSELVERYLNDAAYQLRRVLRPAAILKTYGHGSGYALADQSLLWVDAGACEALLKEVEQRGRTSASALALLEQARTCFARGEFLEGESGLWVYPRRGTFERLQYRCHIWLAEAYEQQGMVGQAEMLYSQLLEHEPSDEEVLYRLLRLLHQQGMTHQAHRCFEETRNRLKHLGLHLSSATETAIKQLLSEPKSIERYGEQRTGSFLAKPSLHLSLTQDIMGEQVLEGATMDHLRRQFIQQSLKAVGTSVIASDIVFNVDMVERLSRVLTGPLCIDESILRYLEHRTASYWQDRHGAILASTDLIGYVLEHFQKTVELLERSLLPAQRIQLCAIASKTALLAGELLLDMGQYEQARRFDRVAITAAQEANDQTLEAISHGRMSLVWTYSKNYQQALINVEQARSLASKIANVTANSWLAAIEAEAQANHHKYNDCLKALDQAERSENLLPIAEDSYLIHFDQALLLGYQGAC